MDRRPTNEPYTIIPNEDQVIGNYKIIYAKSPSGIYQAKAVATSRFINTPAIINEYGESLEAVRAAIQLTIES
ncbi:hypothetical protein [Pseudoalteromonas lipolytica]|uniref:hypothetical protein n=1 Tax=Pseudoalteromonas lipolytica TaxID=570156 RepID=UPI0030A54835